jgi:hypothetical protein
MELAVWSSCRLAGSVQAWRVTRRSKPTASGAEGYRLGASVTQQRYELSNGALDPDDSPDSTESRGGNGRSEHGTRSADGADLDAVQLAERATRDQRISSN